MISYRANAARQLPQPANEQTPVAEPVCGRCGGTGVELWAGKYRPHGSGPANGPCLRCRPVEFLNDIGLKWEAKNLAKLDLRDKLQASVAEGC